MKELSRERFIITGHDQIRQNRVIHFRRALADDQFTLEDVAAADAIRDNPQPAIVEGEPLPAPPAPLSIMDNTDTGPRSEKIITDNATIIPDGTIVVIVKSWQVEVPLSAAKRAAKSRS